MHVTKGVLLATVCASFHLDGLHPCSQLGAYLATTGVLSAVAVFLSLAFDIAALRQRYECAWYAEGGCLGPVTGSLDLKPTLCSVLCGQISGSVARGCFLFARVLLFL